MTKIGSGLEDIRQSLASDLTEWPMEEIHSDHGRGHLLITVSARKCSLTAAFFFKRRSLGNNVGSRLCGGSTWHVHFSWLGQSQGFD